MNPADKAWRDQVAETEPERLAEWDAWYAKTWFAQIEVVHDALHQVLVEIVDATPRRLQRLVRRLLGLETQ